MAYKKLRASAASGVVALFLVCAGGAFSPAMALDTSAQAMRTSGIHQFYVRCKGGGVYSKREAGRDWRAARDKLIRRLWTEGKGSCVADWQGKV